MNALVPLDYVGSAWSLWPPHSDREGINIVNGTRKIAADIISVCLIRKGEDPIHPDLGLAPDLFEPLSNYAPQYWVYNTEQEILRWVVGIEQLRVEIINHRDYENRLSAEIGFVSKLDPDVHSLTFGYYEYQGAIWYQDFNTFLAGIQLDGVPFTGLR